MHVSIFFARLRAIIDAAQRTQWRRPPEAWITTLTDFTGHISGLLWKNTVDPLILLGIGNMVQANSVVDGMGFIFPAVKEKRSEKSSCCSAAA